MTVFRHHRTNNWNYNFTFKGQRYSRECRDADGNLVTSERAAVACEAEARRVAAIAPKLGNANGLTLAQAVMALTSTWERSSDPDGRKRHAREILAYFKPERVMRTISEADIQDYVTHGLAQPAMVWTGGCKMNRDAPGMEKLWKRHPKGKRRSAATVNRYLSTLRSIFKRAHDTRDPVTNERAISEIPKIPKLREPKRKPRPVPQDVLDELFMLLPQHAADALKLTLFFGFRKSEAFDLTIAQVDQGTGRIWLDALKVKGREDAFMPGSKEAMAFVAELVAQARSRKVKHLITYRQGSEPWRPIRDAKKAWSRVMKTINQKFGVNWRWHDLRAAYITKVGLAAGPLAAQKLARHKDIKTTLLYIDVAEDVLRAGANAAASAVTQLPLRVVK